MQTNLSLFFGLCSLPASSVWSFRFSPTLTQTQTQLSSIQTGKNRLCDTLWPLTSEPGPTHNSAGALVLPSLSPAVKDNILEAVTPPSEVNAGVLCPLDHKIYQSLSSVAETGQTVMYLLLCRSFWLHGKTVSTDSKQGKGNWSCLDGQHRSGLYSLFEKFLWVFWYIFFPLWRLVTIGISFNRMNWSCFSFISGGVGGGHILKYCAFGTICLMSNHCFRD